MKIVFFGSASFALPSLNILLENNYDVVAVVTAPDKLGGRGKKQRLETAVKKFAVKKGLKTLQPKNLKASSFIDELKALEPDLQVVVAFRMLPEVVWSLPSSGTFNLHASLLPAYRGAAPINWAIMNGERYTGCTTFFIDDKIDTGNILFQMKATIGDDETAGELHDRLMILGSELVLKTVNAIESEDYETHNQDETLVTKAPKLYRDNCQIDFNQAAHEVFNFIRGLSPYPAAWTIFEGREVKILEARKIMECKTTAEPGSYFANRNELLYFCSDGAIQVLELKPEGKRQMPVQDFLNGFNFNQ
ncbi:MAG TPA: methionyl-tRNA formyltransferase [Saprospiraceae bacterium]|nr:methionyl-tRNA formyltransferase [Saprospiraceae bacterium]